MANLIDVDWSTIPVPPDDGAAIHLAGSALPSLALPSTDGAKVDLSRLVGRTIVYVYPKTGRPGAALPEGWDLIPGARGCTPQACAFRDHYAEIKERGADQVFGLSAQTTAEQKEAANRLHLPFPLLSDEHLQLTEALRLPVLSAPGLRLLRRLTLIIEEGRIVHVLYPVVRPERNAQDVIDWLTAHA